MSQPKHEIEEAYKTPDPWGYKSSDEDRKRKTYILSVIRIFNIHFRRAIDICCGEGWITGGLPADTIHGIEISDNAAGRFPEHVKRVEGPIGKYDLILATGCLYGHYDWKSIVNQIKEAAGPGSLIVLSNIESWEYKAAITWIPGSQVFEARFPYNEHHQKIRIFQC